MVGGAEVQNENRPKTHLDLVNNELYTIYIDKIEVNDNVSRVY